MGRYVLVIVGTLICAGLALVGMGQRPPVAPTRSEQAALVTTPQPTDGCRALPGFLTETGLPQGATLALATDQVKRGLVLQGAGQSYQHPSWSAAGFLGPLAYDAHGNIYVAPVPRVSLADNPPAGATTLWRVESQSGLMQPWLTLPGAANERNPYGVLGLSYACELDLIYAGTVIGSTPQHERGGVVALTPSGGLRAVVLAATDVIGVLVVRVGTGYELYAGLARSPQVIAVPLGPDGRATGPARPMLDLTLAGATASERARKLRLVNGELVIDLVPFNFSLQTGADGQTPARQSAWMYDSDQQVWQVSRAVGIRD